ncbi:MAG: T9SS type A sorting domain-containing protein [Flavobacteriales bacterium]
MRSLLQTLPILLACSAGMCGMRGQAQNITGYRYWFNDNAADITVVDLGAAPVYDTEFVLNSSTLAPGHHLATIQMRDADGLWSAPWSQHFVQRGTTVNGIEYWFDDDVAGTTTTSVTPGAAPLITTPLDAGDLPVGFHTVTLRTVDGQGVRSVPYTVHFTRNGGAVTGYEYWVDDAVADRVSMNIGPASTVDLIAALPVSTAEGEHLFTIRFRDAEEGWSVPLSSTFSFVVGIDEVPGLSNYLLFPNPVSDQLALRLEAAGARDVQVSILDATGRTVQQLGTWHVLGTTHRSWDTGSLARGSYLLSVEAEGRSMRIPFIKQ